MKSTVKLYLAMVAFLLSEIVFSQANSASDPSWVDRRPREFSAMIVALRLLKDTPEAYGIIISQEDQEVLDEILGRMEDVHKNALFQMHELCGLLESMEASEVAASISEITRAEESGYVRLFEYAVNSFSLDVANLLIQGKDALVANSHGGFYTDWVKLAEVDPEAMVKLPYCETNINN